MGMAGLAAMAGEPIVANAGKITDYGDGLQLQSYTFTREAPPSQSPYGSGDYAIVYPTPQCTSAVADSIRLWIREEMEACDYPLDMPFTELMDSVIEVECDDVTIERKIGPTDATKAYITITSLLERIFFGRAVHEFAAATFNLRSGEMLTADLLPEFSVVIPWVEKALLKEYGMKSRAKFEEFIGHKIADLGYDYSYVFVEKDRLCIYYPPLRGAVSPYVVVRIPLGKLRPHLSENFLKFINESPT